MYNLSQIARSKFTFSVLEESNKSFFLVVEKVVQEEKDKDEKEENAKKYAPQMQQLWPLPQSQQ